MLSRRDALKSLAVLGTSAAPLLHGQSVADVLKQSGNFTLPPLPYPADALEPHIDAQTMTIHHDRHHNTYVTNLNTAIAKHASLKGKTIEDLVRNLSAVPDDVRTAVRNNGGGHLNHTLFWNMMRKGGGSPSGELSRAIDKSFGSYSAWQDQFSKAGADRFGSGWAWLVKAPDGALKILSTANQDNPLMENQGMPLLGVDVWEHAYYLKYQNRRADYLKAFFNVINWDFVAQRYGMQA